MSESESLIPKQRLHVETPEETVDFLRDYYFPPYITLAHMFHAPNGWSLKRRSLKQYQFQYVLEGAADYAIGDRVYRTVKGDLIFHRPDEPHGIDTLPNTPYVCLSIVFHFGTSRMPIDELLPAGQHDMGNFSKHQLENLLSELISHYRQPGLPHQLKCQQLLLQAIAILCDREEQKRQPPRTKERSTAKLIRMRNHIEERLQQGFALEELQELTGWSKNHIMNEFKRAFGLTPTGYLVWLRMERAKHLALQSGMTVSEIAHQVGYADVHSFGKTFKRKTGMSLSEFCATLFMQTPDR